MAYETILYEKTDKIAKITLNRPEVRNAENALMSRELDEAFKQAEADDDVRVIILAAAGKDFSAGHDLGAQQSPAAKAAQEAARPKRMMGVEATVYGETKRYHDSRMYIRDIWKATIAQVHGRVMYGACQLPMMCDLIVCSEDAVFMDISARWGLPATEFTTYPWDLGIRKTKELLFTSDPLTAQEAWRLGMVNRVVPREKLEAETMKLAKRVALCHPFGIKSMKMWCNFAEDLQGFKQANLYMLMLHQLGHAYTRENPEHFPFEGGMPGANAGMSVVELIRARNKLWEEEG